MDNNGIRINKEIRAKILEYLYQQDEDNPQNYVGRQSLVDFLGIDEKKVDSNMLYLEDKGHVELIKGMGSLFNMARINSYGKDLVENSGESNLESPKIIQNIASNCFAPVFGDNITQTFDIKDSFKSFYQEIEKGNLDNKEDIKKIVNSVENELKKENPNNSIIIKAIGYLKQNAPSWVISKIFDLIFKKLGGSLQ